MNVYEKDLVNCKHCIQGNVTRRSPNLCRLLLNETLSSPPFSHSPMSLLRRRIHIMPPSRSPSPSAKRIKLAHPPSPAAAAYPAPDDALHALVEEQMARPIEVRKTYHRELDYENKLVLAPMVRTGSCEYARRIRRSTC